MRARSMVAVAALVLGTAAAVAAPASADGCGTSGTGAIIGGADAGTQPGCRGGAWGTPGSEKPRLGTACTSVITGPHQGVECKGGVWVRWHTTPALGAPCTQPGLHRGALVCAVDDNGALTWQI
ncbi:hypothetical protein P0W64_00910 [Tsukamurella sp. 8F]|uniref:hypothetical protein n=1 Tax=unclassified Tsukamurella TaxID=2633480 RepID=UPI0023B908C1|nr:MULTISPECIES: hypothetical protein [unclassified Tsukamurella]MDF0529145.1 hypothetical protein [Tsukamurella sp. 8J]MDF0585330.1 hypothetical protein [Tsukamurella sp. 8F]